MTESVFPLENNKPYLEKSAFLDGGVSVQRYEKLKYRDKNHFVE